MSPLPTIEYDCAGRVASAASYFNHSRPIPSVVPSTTGPAGQSAGYMDSKFVSTMAWAYPYQHADDLGVAPIGSRSRVSTPALGYTTTFGAPDPVSELGSEDLTRHNDTTSTKDGAPVPYGNTNGPHSAIPAVLEAFRAKDYPYQFHPLAFEPRGSGVTTPFNEFSGNDGFSQSYTAFDFDA